MHAWLAPLRGADHFLFRQINQVWTSPWLDRLMPVLTDPHKVPLFVWGVAPAAVAVWLFAKRGRGLAILVGLALTIGATDMISHRIVKPAFKRARPEQAGVPLVLRTRSHYDHSFPSNHAALSFAGAAFMAAVYPPLAWPGFAIASVIAYSRVYVGVHFPFDAAGGALLGLILGTLGARLFLRLAGPCESRRQRRFFRRR